MGCARDGQEVGEAADSSRVAYPGEECLHRGTLRYSRRTEQSNRQHMNDGDEVG
jgi:hypothetical protein